VQRLLFDALGTIIAAGGLQRGNVAPAYSASITPDASLGDWQTIVVTNGTAFTINAPTNPPNTAHTQDLTVEISNTSGGALGAITWNAAFKLVGGAFTNPATGKQAVHQVRLERHSLGRDRPRDG